MKFELPPPTIYVYMQYMPEKILKLEVQLQ